jgi:hypothetical protein
MPDETQSRAAVVSPPKRIPARREAIPVKPKTGRGRGQGKRRRWRGPDGTIYEWDYQHGTLEVYDHQGRHQGEIDPNSGATTKDAEPGRSVEP